MTLAKATYAGEPERIVKERVDCIWITLSPRETPSPLRSQALQWIDWKLQGQISRYLLDQKTPGLGTATFVPTMKRLPTPYIVLSDRLDAQELARGCEGLKLKQVLVFCEDSSQVAELEKRLSGANIPAEITVGTDS